ncbi:hypothetical protein EV294_101710 [Paenibacillus sp. BK033]|uniref:hypothetical protein n=1 Tax=Paenibacillus sp. BK033 TaxID=2512133 RepID=UPI0010485042|nr:hypothetical protein [Paenibacillus sp. BK033]TCN01257.1 hypothetical protein EV294_101710 [Paenibacillus sp. BK033]
MKATKVAATLGTLLIASSVMAACGGNNTDNGNNNGSSNANQTSKADAATNAPAESAAADSNPYAEHYTYEVYSLDAPADFDSFPLVKEAKEKFNIDIKIQQVLGDVWDQKTRTLVASNDLPEVVAWYNLNYGEYVSWAKQGVFKAIDTSKYPNLDKLTKEYKIYDKVKVDGKLYAFPKVIVSNPYNEIGTEMYMYRRDWAKAMGHDFAPVQDMTWDELTNYLKELKEKDPAKLGDKLVPLEVGSGGKGWSGTFGLQFNPNIQTYFKKDGEWEFGAAQPETLEGIKQVKSLYDQGLLAKDSYAYKDGEGLDRLYAGRVGVYYGNQNVANMKDIITKMQVTNPNFKDEDYGVFMVTMPDGKVHVKEKFEWWGSFAFASSIDDKKMDRWLQMGDWLLEQEQLEKNAYGAQGVDWTKDGSAVNVTWPKDAQGNYSFTKDNGKNYINDQKMFTKWFILEGTDVWLEGNPLYSDYLKNDLLKTYVEKAEAAGPVMTPNNYDLDFFTAPNKNKYGTFGDDVRDNFIKAVVSNNPEQVWNSFLKSIEPKVKSVTAELDKGLQ